MNYITMTLIIAILLSAGFNYTQYHDNNRLSEQLNSSNEQVNLATQQISTLNSTITTLDSKTKEYLKAEGKVCDKEAVSCLGEQIERLTTVSGPDCSPILDGLCPSWCAAGADADCCTLKSGYTWILGRGCYGK